jgi:hypothetical protein
MPLSSRFAYALLHFFPTRTNHCRYSLAAVAERSPAQRSAAEAGATSSLDLLKRGALS